MTNLTFAMIPVIAVVIGAIAAVWRRPAPPLTSALQHLAAGIVFGAAAVEILPQIKHEGSLLATALGGASGIIVMLGIKSLEERWKGPAGMLGTVGIDMFIDGLVLGLAFLAGEKAGILLAIALTFEVLFLGLTTTVELGETMKSKAKVVLIVVGLALLLPLGTIAAIPATLLSPAAITGFLAFGMVALLYLVTEELLVEAHEHPDSPLITAMFFIGFLGLLLIEESLG